MSRSMICEIRSMLERHLTASDIAHRLCLDTNDVELVIATLQSS
jgi:hypothetical protein